MKRTFWTTVLAGLVIAAASAKVAVAQGNPTIVIRPIFASDATGQYVGPAVGIVTFNTETGDWTLSTRDRLPSSDYDLYYLAISTSTIQTFPHVGRWVGDSYGLTAGALQSVDGVIEASGTVDPLELDLFNQAIADHGIFMLLTNSI